MGKAYTLHGFILRSRTLSLTFKPFSKSIIQALLFGLLHVTQGLDWVFKDFILGNMVLKAQPLFVSFIMPVYEQLFTFVERNFLIQEINPESI